MTTKNSNLVKEGDWEIEFDKKYPQLFDSAGEGESYICDMTDDVKDFISTLLQTARKESREEVEKEIDNRLLTIKWLWNKQMTDDGRLAMVIDQVSKIKDLKENGL